jgi:hypothetical protein
LRWCFFLNQLMANWEISSMFNSLLICKTQYNLLVFQNGKYWQISQKGLLKQ